MKKKTILDEVVFILFLCYITVTCRHTIVFLQQILLLKHQSVIQALVIFEHFPVAFQEI